MTSKYKIWQIIINQFLKYCGEEKVPVFGNPKWNSEEGTINVIAIRNNNEFDFNNKLRNNDRLLVFENRPHNMFRLYEFPCTTDPASPITFSDFLKLNKGRAHLCEGAYNSYVVRPHNWVRGRTALGQDANKVRVARTDNKSKFLKYDEGFFGINVHDAGRFWNSSLGCIIIAFENNWQYEAEFKPCLERAKSIHKKLGINFTVFLINSKTLGKLQ
jgi:hypothetical protein